MSTNLQLLLKRFFGYDEFRGQQEAIIKRALEQKDSLVIMPTGAGKSLCYQLPALALEGTVIVISPLIALMKDQVDALRANGIAAGALNSSISGDEAQSIAASIGTDELKLLYISPEKAVNRYFIDFIKSKKISLIAIDEAHCVSIWGNDFRQEYTHLPSLTQFFPDVPVMALTATADKATQSDITQKLQLKDSKKFISSFERKNLLIKVKPAYRRIEAILDFVKNRKSESGIIYCLSRKSTEMVAEKLRHAGINAFHYHAELTTEQRNGVQKAFQQDEIKVICATIAFGMGIDKSNVRYVLHYNLPKNLESYYQEIGRAGRDGVTSETLLFYSINDGKIYQQFIDNSEADENFKMVQRSKLHRMIDFCQSTSCRTNMILSYFGEYRTKACGHCDNCLSPPKHFDGTVIAQKALSASKRLNEKVAVQMLVDVLRGSQKKEIQKAGYDKIKTFGAGADINREDWVSYISQLINQGYFEIDFTDHNHLKITSIGNLVLERKLKVKLSQPFQQLPQDFAPRESKKAKFKNDLFERLKSIRLTLAKMEDVPAYIIFNDATLKEMCEIKPLYMSDMAAVSGVGNHKLEKYGELFLDEIKKFISSNKTLKSVKGKTYLETLELLQQGFSVEEIAAKRNLNSSTIFSHISHLYEKGEEIDISQYISEEEINTISAAWYKLNKPESLKEVFDHLNEAFEYHKIRLALSFIKRPEPVKQE